MQLIFAPSLNHAIASFHSSRVDRMLAIFCSHTPKIQTKQTKLKFYLWLKQDSIRNGKLSMQVPTIHVRFQWNLSFKMKCVCGRALARNMLDFLYIRLDLQK